MRLREQEDVGGRLEARREMVSIISIYTAAEDGPCKGLVHNSRLVVGKRSMMVCGTEQADSLKCEVFDI